MSTPQFLLSLNFLALDIQKFEFEVYRKPYNASESKNDTWHQFSLPVLPQGAYAQECEWLKYWVSLCPELGFERFVCQHNDNRYLTLLALCKALEEKATQSGLDFNQSSGYRRLIEFKVKEHPEGWQIIKLEPYFLKSVQKIGFLIDFKFQVKADFTGDRRIIQKLSLSLDENDQNNANSYIDRLRKLQIFINRFIKTKLISPLKYCFLEELQLEEQLYPVEAGTLQARKYVFANGQESDNRLLGLKTFGPLKSVSSQIHYHVICHSSLMDDARCLWKALKGEKYKNLFPGLHKMFALTEPQSNSVTAHSLDVLDSNTIEIAFESIKSASSESIRPILISVLPNKQSNRDYAILKSHALREKYPIQVVTSELIVNEAAFQWSISGIGLQMFAKLGGQPWKVKSSQNSLIIGIGQAHQVSEDSSGHVEIEKFFAYSVLMDSSGVYKNIQKLGDSSDESNYLEQIRSQIRKIIDQFSGEFSKFVIHTPFKLGCRGLDAIKGVIDEYAHTENDRQCEFVVIKVNEHNKFCAYDRSSNSHVPPESTYLQLSKNEFLIWFEGISKSSPKAKRYSRPFHIEFYYASRDISYADRMLYLQDLINLAGSSWRGFNTKLMPVSIFYCKLIAEQLKDLQMQGYSQTEIDASIPWFI